MRMFKKIVACLLAVAMLASVAVVVCAEEAALIDSAIQHSITEEADTGFGVAFRIKMNIQGAQMNARNEFINTTATAVVDGVEYAVVKMGAVMANQAADIANLSNLTLEDVNEERTVLNVAATYLCEAPAADHCVFAVRITYLPLLAMGRAIACRPYVVLADANGVETTVYGDGNITTYKEVYYTYHADEIPALDLSVADVDDKIAASASAVYVPYDTVSYAEAFKVSLTLTNGSANAKTSNGDAITYTCKDAEGNDLCTEKVVVNVLNPGESKTVDVYAPIGTATIEATGSTLTYVPAITLPEIGFDIDVVKKKNRIRVSAASAAFNEDGSIAVSLTFRNYTSNWITEETDYIQYTYYNAAGEAIKTENLYIGVIDTKKHPIKTFTFNVPANAASVKITNSKIVYWTEWA